MNSDKTEAMRCNAISDNDRLCFPVNCSKNRAPENGRDWVAQGWIRFQSLDFKCAVRPKRRYGVLTTLCMHCPKAARPTGFSIVLAL